MNKRKKIQLLMYVIFISFAFSNESKAQKKHISKGFTAYGYLSSGIDTSHSTFSRLYSIEKFDGAYKLISRVLLDKKNDTIQSWSYDKNGRLIKEMYKKTYSCYYYSLESLLPDSCLSVSFINDNFPIKESGKFHIVNSDSIKLENFNKISGKVAQALMTTSDFPNYPDKKMLFSYSDREKTTCKAEYRLNQREEELTLNSLMQFNEMNQPTKFQYEVFDYGGYDITREEFFYNKAHKLTYAFGYYDKKIKDKPDYIICYRYFK